MYKCICLSEQAVSRHQHIIRAAFHAYDHKQCFCMLCHPIGWKEKGHYRMNKKHITQLTCDFLSSRFLPQQLTTLKLSCRLTMPDWLLMTLKPSKLTCHGWRTEKDLYEIIYVIILPFSNWCRTQGGFVDALCKYYKRYYIINVML